jgi:endonuclease/exonuclease/phosphatase (EEP) superfamily protein YafD
MLAIFHAVMFIYAAVSVVDYTGQVTISEGQPLVSNHRDELEHAEDRQCEPGSQAKPLENIANNELVNQGLDPDGIRLLNWNILKGSRQNWREDFQRLTDASDIVALQEAQLHDEFHVELEESNLHWDLTTAFYYGDAETGVLIGSSIKPGLSCALHANEPIVMIPKSALVTEYQIRGTDETLLVANIHMINFSFSTDEYQQQISQLVEVIQHHDGPMIITGDFNTWNQDRIDIINNTVLGLKLSVVEYNNDYRLTVFRNPVDHVYFRGLEILHANTERVESSDHNPMMVTFRVASL